MELAINIPGLDLAINASPLVAISICALVATLMLRAMLREYA